jgi:hypothetical protein
MNMINFDCGIYCITGPNGMQYIGQTQSFSARWKKHLRDLRIGKHRSPVLQKDFDLYGESEFHFAKIAFVPMEQFEFREQEQIDSRPRELLYNRLLKVSRPKRGDEISLTTRQRLRDATSATMQNADYRANLSKLWTGAGNPLARAVLCVETGVTFGSLNDAARWLRETGKSKARNSLIVSACKGRCRGAYGYTWQYVDQTTI